MADWETFSELQGGGEKVQELGSRIEDRQTTAEDDASEGRKDVEEEEIEEEIEEEEEEEEEFPGEQRAEEISVDAGEGEEEVVLMLDDTYEDDFEEDDDDDEDDEAEDEQPEADQETSRAETRKRKHDDDDDDSNDEEEDYVEDKEDKKDEAAGTVPRVEDVRNFVETLVGNAVKNLEAEVAARHRQIQESGEGLAQELTEADKTVEETQETQEVEEEEEGMDESSSEDESFPELSMVLDGPQRDALFEKGMQYQNRGRLEYALKCYLGCLKDLDDTEGFSSLPHCLHQIADTFYRKEEYDKAVQFIQAEKLYYENALIDTSELQKALSDATKRGQGDIGPPDPRVVRAMEFENLARMCVQRKKPQLALEYCGKAVKAYQAVLGEDHPATTQCLDYFTVIYAEAGRKEYSDAMGQFQSGQEETTGQLDGSSTLQREGATAGETSGVRRRAQGSVEKEEETGEVHFEPQVVVQDLDPEADEPSWVVPLLVVLVVMLVMMFLLIYCGADRTSSFCSSFRSNVHYYYLSLRYKLRHFLPAGWG